MNDKINRQIIQVIEFSETPVDIESIRATVKHSREILMAAIDSLLEIGTIGSDFNIGTNRYEYYMMTKLKPQNNLQVIDIPVTRKIKTQVGIDADSKATKKMVNTNKTNTPTRSGKKLPTWLKELFDANRGTYFDVFQILELMVEKPTTEGTLRDALRTLKNQKLVQTVSAFSKKKECFLTAYGWSKDFKVPEPIAVEPKSEVAVNPTKTEAPTPTAVQTEPIPSDATNNASKIKIHPITTATITKVNPMTATHSPNEEQKLEQKRNEILEHYLENQTGKLVPLEVPASIHELPKETKFFSSKDGLIIITNDGSAMQLSKGLTNQLIDTLIGSHKLLKIRANKGR